MKGGKNRRSGLSFVKQYQGEVALAPSEGSLSVSRSKHCFWTPKIIFGEFPQTPPFLTNEKGISKMKNQQTILIKENSNEQNFSSIISLPIAKLKPFANHPYKVIDNEEMQCLAESIKSQGVLNPITVRPISDGYEIISGHRRVFACKKLGVEFVPAFVPRSIADFPVTMERKAIATRLPIRKSSSRSTQRSTDFLTPSSMWTTATREQISTAPTSNECLQIWIWDISQPSSSRTHRVWVETTSRLVSTRTIISPSTTYAS